MAAGELLGLPPRVLLGAVVMAAGGHTVALVYMTVELGKQLIELFEAQALPPQRRWHSRSGGDITETVRDRGRADRARGRSRLGRGGNSPVLAGQQVHGRGTCRAGRGPGLTVRDGRASRELSSGRRGRCRRATRRAGRRCRLPRRPAPQRAGCSTLRGTRHLARLDRMSFPGQALGRPTNVS